MLTKRDLQAIKKLFITEGDSIKDDMKASLKQDIDAALDKHLKPIKRDIRKIRSDVEEVIDHFDRRDLHLQKRMKRVEDHLKLPSIPQN